MKYSTKVEELYINYKVTASARNFLNQSAPKKIQITSDNSYLLNITHNVKIINSKSNITIDFFNKHTLCYFACVIVHGNFKGNHISRTI